MGLIIEGLLTTTAADGQPHLAPMGATVDDGLDEHSSALVLRPFTSSGTYANLLRTGAAVFHVTDDVELITYAALQGLTALPELRPCSVVNGWIVAGACRWYALRKASSRLCEPRAHFEMQIVDRGQLRDFVGFNRAKHAVLEAAIAATRIDLLGTALVLADFERLSVAVEKTGGAAEQRAFRWLERYVAARAGESS